MTTDIFKILAFLIAVYILTVIQLSFVQTLLYPWSQISLVIAAVYLIGLVWNYHLGLGVGMWAGFLLELSSPLTPGAMVVPLIISLLIINFLFKLLFTNRSVYSMMILTVVGGMFYHLGQWLIEFVAQHLGWTYRALIVSPSFLQAMVWQISLTTLVVVIIFLIFYRFSKLARSNFLLGSRR